jgi:hypothetical protein
MEAISYLVVVTFLQLLIHVPEIRAARALERFRARAILNWTDTTSTADRSRFSFPNYTRARLCAKRCEGRRPAEITYRFSGAADR